MNIFNTQFNYKKRLEKLRKLMEENGIDVILVYLWPNQYYISGMYQHLPWYPVEVCEHTETPLIIFKDKEKEPIFLITWLTGIGLKEGTWLNDVRIIDKEPFGDKPWWEYVSEILKEYGLEKGVIGIEEDVCVLSTFKKLKKALPQAQFTRVDEIFHLVRMIKEPEEIDIIRESVLIAEAGLKAGMETAKVGVLESEVQKAAEIEMKKRGAIREVETMCQSGKRTANHRAFGANWKKIEKGDLVTIDIGCVFKGYGSDLTRTWVVGKPKDIYKKVLNDLRNIREKVISHMKPGVALQEIYNIGQNEFKKAGYIMDKRILPKNDVGLGNVTVHGIGLGPMHDPPHVEDKEIKLQEGMTLAVTCGARFLDFTIRYEDDLIMTSNGIELLNKLIPWDL